MTDPTTAALAEGLALSRGTDFYRMRDQLTPDEAELLDRLRSFGESEILPLVNDYWERGEFPFEVIDKLRKLNIAGAMVRGYTPISAVGQGLISYELGRLDGSIGTFLGVHSGLAMQSIYILGSEEQRQRWLPSMERLEKIGAFALTEPDHGSDSIALETTARRDGDDWVITGRKKWIGNGSIADVVVLWARDVADGQVKGFLVTQGTPGYQATVIENKGSLRAVWQAEITLTDVRVPEANRLPHARSFADTGKVLVSTRASCAWAALGHAVAGYDAALTYAKRRTQFGKPLVSFQLIQSRLVKMLAKVTAMQLYCRRLADLQAAGSLDATLAGLAKMHNTATAREVLAEARDLLGGNGILLDFHVIRHMSDIEAIHTYEGTESMQTLIVGRDITGVSA